MNPTTASNIFSENYKKRTTSYIEGSEDDREENLPNKEDAEPEDSESLFESDPSDYFMDDTGRVHITLDYWGD